MIAAETAVAPSFNWYDIVVGVALLYGLWSGIRTGLFGEVLRVAGIVLMVVAAVKLYIPVGDRLREATQMAQEPARLLAFVAIALVVYVATLALRNFITARVKKFKFLAIVDNLGGAVAGVVRMAVGMAFVTLMISLMRSPFWHQQVSTQSVFGSTVVAQFPAVQEVVKKSFPEKLWISEELKRRPEPDVDNAGAQTAPR